MTSTPSNTERLTELAATPWDEELLTHFADHLAGEQELLMEYATIRDSGPEHVRYLVDLIMADEQRHHQTFQELVNRVRSDIDFRDYEPKVPYIGSPGENRAALLEATERMLAFEHADQRSLHRLQKELRPVRRTTLFSLLVELMELDTKKHVAILEFLQRSAAARY